MPHDSEAPAVRRALRALADAERAVQQLDDRIRSGDDTVTAADTLEAREQVRIMGLRVESARRVVADEAERVRQAKVDAGTRRRERIHARAAAEAEDAYLRTIRSGEAERHWLALLAAGSPQAAAELEKVRAHPEFRSSRHNVTREAGAR